jgi:hypothetical protein
LCPSSWWIVEKSSAVWSMHILMRRSFMLSTFHALGWQTTSRSRGFTNSDRSQNVFGSGAKPSDEKNRSPILTISTGSILRAFRVSVSENAVFSPAGAARS